MYPDSVLYVFFAKRNIPRYTVTCLGTHWAGDAVDSCFQVVLLGMIAHWVHNAFPYFPWLAFHTLIAAPGCFADPASILVATFLLLLKKKFYSCPFSRFFKLPRKGEQKHFYSVDGWYNSLPNFSVKHLKMPWELYPLKHLPLCESLYLILQHEN